MSNEHLYAAFTGELELLFKLFCVLAEKNESRFTPSADALMVLHRSSTSPCDHLFRSDIEYSRDPRDRLNTMSTRVGNVHVAMYWHDRGHERIPYLVLYTDGFYPYDLVIDVIERWYDEFKRWVGIYVWRGVELNQSARDEIRGDRPQTTRLSLHEIHRYAHTHANHRFERAPAAA